MVEKLEESWNRKRQEEADSWWETTGSENERRRSAVTECWEVVGWVEANQAEEK